MTACRYSPDLGYRVLPGLTVHGWALLDDQGHRTATDLEETS